MIKVLCCLMVLIGIFVGIGLTVLAMTIAENEWNNYDWEDDDDDL